jgi:hypothetical protein
MFLVQGRSDYSIWCQLLRDYGKTVYWWLRIREIPCRLKEVVDSSFEKSIGFSLLRQFDSIFFFVRNSNSKAYNGAETMHHQSRRRSPAILKRWVTVSPLMI